MVKKIQLVPTLLTYSFSEFKDKLRKIEKYFSLVQIDVMDNKFVKNKTFYEVNKVRKLRSYKGEYELHLMVLDPLKIIKKWQNFRKFKKVIFHYEAVTDVKKIFNLINYLKKHKLKAGLAINPATKLEKIEIFLPYLNFVFLMGVKPGWGNQKLDLAVLKKAQRIRKMYPKLDIEIDGGVNLQNIKLIIQSGVNIIAAGTLFFKSRNIKKTISQIKDLIK